MPSPPHARTTSLTRWWSHRKVQNWYNVAVVHGTYRLLWRCHVRHVLGLYYNTVQDGDTVLEIGPANGGHLDNIDRANLDLHLLDAFEGPLHAASERLTRYQPTTHLADALDPPFPLERDSADAVMLSMVVHCLPGQSITDKAAVFDGVARVLRPGGRFAGATVLANGVAHTRRSRAGLAWLNRKNVFSCYDDSLSELEAALTQRFDVPAGSPVVRTVGSVALWQVIGR